MRICFFTENYHKGGLDTFLINLFNAWPDDKDELVLVCNESHPGIETIIQKTSRQLNIQTYKRLFTGKMASGQFEDSNFSGAINFMFKLTFKILEYPVLFPWYCLSLKKLFRKNNFDRLMVVNGGYPASLLCRCAVIAWEKWGKRPKAVLNFHNSATKASSYAAFAENSIDKAVLNAASNVISVSKNCINSLSIRKAFNGSAKTNYIYNGIADPLTGLLRWEDGSDHNNSYLLMLATYEERKGHSFLLDAFQKIRTEFPYVRLLIYGFGLPEEKRLVSDKVKALSLEDSVILNDFTSETTSLIANATVLVVPSQSHESFGLTIIEAMALKTPVVTTDVGGMPEVLAGSNAGYVCSKDDPKQFADQIKKIIRDPSLRSTLGMNGRSTFEKKFIASKMAAQYYSLITDKDLKF